MSAHDVIVVSPPRSMALMHDVETRVHAYPAHQMVTALEGELEVWRAARWVRARTAAFAPNEPHAMRIRGAALVTFFEPDLAMPVGVLPAKLAETTGLLALRYGARIHEADLAPRLAEELLRVVGAERWKRHDRRAAEAAEIVAASAVDVPLDSLAASVGLSRYRLSHLFAETFRVSLRSYAVWWKIARALEAYAAGAPTLTGVAHAGNFADQAHFTRSFVRMFGLTPSQCLRR